MVLFLPISTFFLWSVGCIPEQAPRDHGMTIDSTCPHAIEDRVPSTPSQNLEIHTHCLCLGHILMPELGTMPRAVAVLIRLSQSGFSSDIGVGLIFSKCPWEAAWGREQPE